MTAVDLFVGRESQLREAIDLLTAPGRGAVQDIVGVRGLGKTSFLQRLSELARDLKLPGQDIRVHNLDMQQHGLGVGFLPGDLGANASVDIVREVFTTSRQLMHAVAGEQREFRGFRLLSQQLGREARLPPSPTATVTLGKGTSVGQMDVAALQQDDAAFRQHIRALQGQLDDGFVEAWEEFTARRRVLITVDTFQLAADNELGQWFVRMARRLRNTLTVLARTPSDTPLWREGGGPRPVELPFFGVDEIADYLGRRLGAPASPTALAETTHDFTDGHPEGVNLVGDLIINRGGADLGAGELRRILDSLPSEDEQQFWAGLVAEILESVRSDDLQRAVDAASVVGMFDSRLLAELLEPGNPRETDVGKIITKLSGLRMLHPVPAISGGPSGRFRLHEFVQQAVSLRLRATTPGEWQRLQSVTAQHYFRRLEEWEEEPYDSYGAWYRFEDEDWQECKRQWLRHSGLAPERAFVTRARFTLVFLEAFWWWGYYVPFPFMRQLLDDWARVSAEWARTQAVGPVPLERREDLNQVLMTALTEMINDYPETHIKPRTSPWDAIRDNLIKVRTLCGLTPAGKLSQAARKRATAEEQAEIIRTDAFITLFLAQTRRFRDPDDPSAERLYDAALAAFRELDDEWTAAWIFFERSDLALERLDLPASAGRLAEGAAVASGLATRTDEWDQELLANLHRTWADACWLDGRPDEAAHHYGWAIANAYWFHGEPSTVDGDPHGPDDYTRQFYLEMTLRASQRIMELADRPVQRDRFVRELLREVPREDEAPIVDLADATVDGLREALFPPGPAEDELLSIGTPFMERWNALFLVRRDPLGGLDELIHAAAAAG